MSKNSYIIKFDDKEDYEINKSKLVASSTYETISTCNNFWVLHYLTIDEYDKIKSDRINISLDDETLEAC